MTRFSLSLLTLMLFFAVTTVLGGEKVSMLDTKVSMLDTVAIAAALTIISYLHDIKERLDRMGGAS
jgi:hypothetical protein